MALVLVRSAAEWRRYTESLDGQHHFESPVDWGKGPLEYPALVASKPLPDRRVLSCYVYVGDAMRLLEAAGYQCLPASRPVAEAGVPATVLPPTAVPQQEETEHKRHVSAMLLAIVQELIEVKLTNEERFERLLAAKLAEVDQYHADAKAHSQDSPSGFLLPRLYPGEDSAAA